jgi:DNA-binding MarR family transcriptional regulator
MPGAHPLPFDPIEEARRQWIAHGWEDAADGMAALTSIIRVEQILMSRVEAHLRPLGLTFARYELLVLLDFSRNGSLPLGKIGARLQVHPASVTNAVDRLEADGLVERVAHPDDGRTRLATITPAGRRTVRRATRTLNEQVFSDLGWSRRDLDALFRILRRLRKASGDFA